MEEKKCEECGKTYTARTNMGRWCSKECRRLFRKKSDHNALLISNPTPEIVNCKFCGKEFKPTTKSNTVCSDDCRNKIKDKQRKDKIARELDSLIYICSNKECSKEFKPYNKNQKICSDECKRAIVKVNKKKHRSKDDVKQKMKDYGAKYFIKYYAENKERLCEYQKEYKRQNQDLIKERNTKYYKTEDGKATARRASGRRRALIMGTISEKIDYNMINERDGFKCNICHKKVDMNLEHPHPMSKSYDHIVPLSLGGEDTNRNIALTHFRCNLIKHNNISEGVQPLLLS